MPKIDNIVLVHGGFVDGVGWRGVYDVLKKDGFNVSIVQNPTISLAGDVGATAGDVDSATAAFMADSQVPWGVDALAGAITEPALKSKPSWYLPVREDKMIPYPAQQFMAKRAGATVVEVPGSHAIYVSNPSAVAALIEEATSGVQ
jgi:pimeloyl-ACP methyl ester carboxylesterase